MSVRMNSLGALALALVAGVAGATPPVAPDARAVVAPWTAQASDTSSFTAPDGARTRLPAPTDVGVAWDRIGHRGQPRWECRAVPSGWFVMASLCANLPQVDTRWPGNDAPPGWDGVVHGD